jgi:methyl-accepting chemotaxis protein
MKWFEDVKIGVKLVVSFILVAAIAGIIGVVGLINISQMRFLATEMHEKMTEPTGTLIFVTNAYKNIESTIRDVLIDEEASNVLQYENFIKEQSADFDKYLNVYAETLLTDAGRAVIETLRADKSAYMNTINQVLTYARNGDRESAVKLLYGEGRQVENAMEAAIATVTDMKLAVARTSNADNISIAEKATRTTTILVVVGVVGAVLLGVLISQSISKPIARIITSANEIAKGNLDVEIESTRKDEIGLLSKAFADMAQNMNEVLSYIQHISVQVASAAKEVSNSSVELSEGATEQASAVEELTASIEEITAQTRLNAEHSQNANTLTEKARKDAVEGNAQMKDMLRAMEEINISSVSISKIIKVIDEIAFQTNILALNAAVEAARAGQHGKGFAVVAEEVRNLAARSASAAKETTQMIEDSMKEVEGGMKIATQTASALNNIVEGVANVAGIVSEISTASNEQAIAIEQINQGVMQIADVVQNNSATSEESAAASEELSAQAESLSEQVAKFKLKK